MSLVQWDPFRELSMFDTPFTRVLRQATPADEEAGPCSWLPVVDVYEADDHALVVTAEVPGIDRKDVSITLDDGVLTIAGERKIDSDVNRERWHRSERHYGSFRRSFTVPRTVDAGAVSAEHKDGTLRVRLPLKEDAKPHRISIKAA